MNQSPSSSSNTSGAVGGGGFSLARVLAVLVPLVIILLIAFIPLRNRMAEPETPVDANAWAKLFRLDTSVTNRLDIKFSDANQDLVADTPANAAELVRPEVLVFSYIPDETDEVFQQAWQPLLRQIGDATGLEVRYEIVASTDEQLRGLVDGRLHILGFNTGAVPVAVNLGGFVPVAKLPGIDGTGAYTSQILVPAASPIENVNGLQGKELTLTHPRSNSGYKAPVVLLYKDHALQPGRDYQVRISGSHLGSILNVAQGAADAVAVASDLLAREVASGTIESDAYHTIFESPAFPTACLGYAHNLAPEVASAIRDVILSYDWSGTALEERLSPPGGRTTFVPVNYVNDWALIRQIDDATGNQHSINP